MTALQWIHSQWYRFQTFVADRVSEILESTRCDQWRHVPGSLNPTDDCSRGLPVAGLSSQHRWFTGPEFLRASETDWPVIPIVIEPDPDSAEIRHHVTANVKAVVERKRASSTEFYARYSDLSKAVRVVAWITRPIKIRRHPEEHHHRRILVTEDVRCAMQVCIRWIQQAEFPQELKCIGRVESVPVDSSLCKVSPFIGCTRVMQVGGRLTNALVSRSSRCTRSVMLNRKFNIWKMMKISLNGCFFSNLEQFNPLETFLNKTILNSI